jgi:hypothetical protein
VAGFAKGGAAVRLESESPEATILHYEVDALAGGKLARLDFGRDHDGAKAGTAEDGDGVTGRHCEAR